MKLPFNPLIASSLVLAAWLLAGLLATSPPAAAMEELAASVDRTTLASGETLELTLTYPGKAAEDPDFSPLDTDFEILDHSRRNQVSMVNGSFSATSIWRLTLAPKRAGDLQIPPLTAGDARSHALSIQVTLGASESTTAERPVFAEAILDKEQAVPGEQVMLSLRLYTRIDLSNLSMEPLAVPGAELIQIAENKYHKEIQGQTYQVIELRYALIPEQEGELNIPGARFGARTLEGHDPFARAFGGGGRPLRISSEPRTLPVTARPAGAATSWLPVQALHVEQKWSTAASQVQLGEPITRTITLTATGTTSARIPPLELSAPQGYRRYPDQPELHDDATAAGLSGRRVESFAVVADQPGPLALPPIRVRWWNTETRAFEETEVPGARFEILPAAGAPQAAAVAPIDTAPAPATEAIQTPAATAVASSGATPLLYGLIAGNLLLLLSTLTFALLWRRRGTTTGTASEPTQQRADFRAVERAAATGDGVRLRAAILAWAREHWQDAGIVSLRQIAERAGSEHLRTVFRALDDSCYAPGGRPPPNTEELLAQLRSLAKMPASERKKPGRDLQPLYPR
ncbi:MAG: BatD family protein [Gammaproteobacteria bacterium]